MPDFDLFATMPDFNSSPHYGEKVVQKNNEILEEIP